ncbi:GcrA family cell cycle regulator [Vitreimonas flagellata]|uniref:GcrA family cell cycle regulator n=1 Tax=Vitreimonas flagellata TaxID=2560861 RepID=UPI0010752530|nr:GcrA family cell cycle regulator [Vitreimonas flagellata]
MSEIGWTAERIATLGKLWSEGLSSGEIARALGGVTRNAVIGKVHRLGLGARVARVGGRANGGARPKRATRAVVMKAPRVNPKPAKLSPGEELARVRALRPIEIDGAPRSALTLRYIGECKFGIGDPRCDADFAFCGRATDGTQVYCAEHRKLVYEKASKPQVDASVAGVRKLLEARDRQRQRRGAFGVGTIDLREAL